MFKKIKEFLTLVDEYKPSINEEINDNKEAEEIWALMTDLESKLENYIDFIEE
jgi:hypothetical protein